MKKFFGLMAILAVSAFSAQAQTTPQPATEPSMVPALTPEQQAQRATDAKAVYDAQKQQSNVSDQAVRSSRSQLKETANLKSDLKKQLRAQRQQEHAQKDLLKQQRNQAKEAKQQERAARDMAKVEKKRAREMK